MSIVWGLVGVGRVVGLVVGGVVIVGEVVEVGVVYVLGVFEFGLVEVVIGLCMIGFVF